MPLYEYSCPNCENSFDAFRSFSDFAKRTNCPRCGNKADRLMSLPHTHKDLLYNFVDTMTGLQPVEIHGKDHWKRHLKSKGMTDDVSNEVPKMGQMKQVKNESSKAEKIEGHKKVIENVLRSEGAIR